MVQLTVGKPGQIKSHFWWCPRNTVFGLWFWSPKPPNSMCLDVQVFFVYKTYFWYPLSWAICAHLKPLEVVWQKGWIPVMLKTYESLTRPPLLQRPWQAVAHRISFNLTTSGNAQKPLNNLQIEFGLWDHFFCIETSLLTIGRRGNPKLAHLQLISCCE